MHVKVLNSKVHGKGLFVTKDFKKGEKIFEEQIIQTPSIFSILGKQWEGISHAWALTYQFLCYGVPDWFQEAETADQLVEFEMKDTLDQDMARELKKIFPAKDVMSIFSKVICNFYEYKGNTWISYLTSKINHSVNANTGHILPFAKKNVIIFFATKDLSKGDELFVTYPQTFTEVIGI